MMKQLEAWASEVRSHVIALGDKARILGVNVAPIATITPPVGAAGFPGVVPLWSNGTDRTAGLVARPNTAFEEWPGVVIARGQGLTVASNARTLLTEVIVTRILSNAPDTAVRLAKSWESIREGAEALHRSLGGGIESLEAVIDVATTPEKRKALYYDGEEKRAPYEAAHSAAFRAVDKSTPFAEYADWLDEAIARKWKRVDPPEKYGPWARRLICSAQCFESSWGVDLGIRREWFDWLILGGAGVDSAVPEIPSWDVGVGASSGESVLVLAAEKRANFDDSEFEPAPIADGLTAAILEQGSGYRGLAHAEAAAAYDESDRPKQAWEALQNAAWWSARNTGSTPEVIRRGMLLLAQRRGWADIEWVVRNSMPEGVA